MPKAKVEVPSDPLTRQSATRVDKIEGNSFSITQGAFIDVMQAFIGEVRQAVPMVTSPNVNVNTTGKSLSKPGMTSLNCVLSQWSHVKL